MSGHATLTLIGNLIADPELRVTSGGDPVASFTVAATPRILDRGSGKWSDGDTLYLRCSAWRQLGENVAESLNSGTRVWVQGRLKQRTFETREGEKRTVIEMDVDEIGPSLRYATAKINRGQRGSGGGGFGGGGGGGAATEPPDDPWGSAAPAGGGYSEEPPF